MANLAERHAADGEVLFSNRQRVYYDHTDASGVVYHACYVNWLEHVRSDWLRDFGICHQQLAQEQGIGFVVASLSIDYLKPAVLEDELIISIDSAILRRASMRFTQSVKSSDGLTCYCRASVKVACIDLASLAVRALPNSITRIK